MQLAVSLELFFKKNHNVQKEIEEKNLPKFLLNQTLEIVTDRYMLCGQRKGNIWKCQVTP